MVEEFIEGEVYSSLELVHHVYVLGIPEETADQVTLSTLCMNIVTKETYAPTEITVKKSDFGDWSRVDLTSNITPYEGVR